MKANGWIDFRPDQAFAPAVCDDWSLVNDIPKVLTWAWNLQNLTMVKLLLFSNKNLTSVGIQNLKIGQ